MVIFFHLSNNIVFSLCLFLMTSTKESFLFCLLMPRFSYERENSLHLHSGKSFGKGFAIFMLPLKVWKQKWHRNWCHWICLYTTYFGYISWTITSYTIFQYNFPAYLQVALKSIMLYLTNAQQLEFRSNLYYDMTTFCYTS